MIKVAKLKDGTVFEFDLEKSELFVSLQSGDPADVPINHYPEPDIGNPVEVAVRMFADEVGLKIEGPIHDPYQNELFDPSAVY